MDWLSLLGPLLCCVGAVLTCLDLVAAPARFYRQLSRAAQATAIRALHDSARIDYEKSELPTSERGEAIAAVETTKSNLLDAASVAARHLDEAEARGALRRALWGLLLIAVGSGMQSLPPLISLYTKLHSAPTQPSGG